MWHTTLSSKGPWGQRSDSMEKIFAFLKCRSFPPALHEARKNPQAHTQPLLCKRHSWKVVSFSKILLFSFFILKCFLMCYWHILEKRSQSSSMPDFSDTQVCCLLNIARSVSDFWNFKDIHFSIYLISSELSDEGYGARAAQGQRLWPHGSLTLQASAEPTLCL